MCTTISITDGSKIEGSAYVDCATFCPELNIRLNKSINKYASVFTAEHAALNNALDIVLSNGFHDFFIFFWRT